jgi:hypothetical protein
MTNQGFLFPVVESSRGTGPLVAAYGGGVNTIAMLLLLKKLGERPDAIVMADPGSERERTLRYRDEVMNPWLAAEGWPLVTVVSVKSEAPFRPRASRTKQRTLLEECLEIRSLPSIAYGYKKCSLKYKARPSTWWVERQEWAQAAWARGEKITRAIGYDIDEPERARPEFMDAQEAKHFRPYYPLLNANMDREACERLILASGLLLPGKSSCRWCPANTLQEWHDLYWNDPQGWSEAMRMSQNAVIESPDVVGLMRCNKAGNRQLHLYVFPDRPDTKVCEPDDDDRKDMPCECAL